MKIVIAMDSFKGSVSAQDACLCIANGITSVIPEVNVIIKPIADGGEGTAKTIMAARGGKLVTKTAAGPMPKMKIKAGYLWFDESRTAIVEMASANGLTLLKKSQMNPLLTTTFGTCQLIKSTLDKKPKKVLLAIRGSLTVDGGVGAAMVLGLKFLDKNNQPIGFDRVRFEMHLHNGN